MNDAIEMNAIGQVVLVKIKVKILESFLPSGHR